MNESFEIRYDPIHLWPVMYAPARAKRPLSLKEASSLESSLAVNPFAEHREELTTPERYAIRNEGTEPDGPGWLVRIIGNKYPALEEAELTEQSSTAVGVHDVIIESPEPIQDATDLKLEQWHRVFHAYRTRLANLVETTNFAHATIFKNQGRAAGASQPHVHSQLMATQFVPPLVQAEFNHSVKLTKENGTSYFENWLNTERENAERIVLADKQMTLLCPAASRFAFEMHLYPNQNAPHFHLAKDDLLEQAADWLQLGLKSLKRCVHATDWNFVLHTSPFSATEESSFHWHWEIYPRLAGIAGWELGQGGYVNPVFPEDAAQLLRENLIIP